MWMNSKSWYFPSALLLDPRVNLNWLGCDHTIEKYLKIFSSPTEIFSELAVYRLPYLQDPYRFSKLNQGSDLEVNWMMDSHNFWNKKQLCIRHNTFKLKIILEKRYFNTRRKILLPAGYSYQNILHQHAQCWIFRDFSRCSQIKEIKGESVLTLEQ